MCGQSGWKRGQVFGRRFALTLSECGAVGPGGAGDSDADSSVESEPKSRSAFDCDWMRDPLRARRVRDAGNGRPARCHSGRRLGEFGGQTGGCDENVSHANSRVASRDDEDDDSEPLEDSEAEEAREVLDCSRCLGWIFVEGRTKATKVYEVFEPPASLRDAGFEAEAMATEAILGKRDRFYEAQSLWYAGNWKRAHQEFSRLLEECPSDLVVGLFVEWTARDPANPPAYEEAAISFLKDGSAELRPVRGEGRKFTLMG